MKGCKGCTFLIVDLNARVSKSDEDSNNVLGASGNKGHGNINDYRLINLCTENNLLIITNTFYKHKYIWEVEYRNEKSSIDYILLTNRTNN